MGGALQTWVVIPRSAATRDLSSLHRGRPRTRERRSLAALGMTALPESIRVDPRKSVVPPAEHRPTVLRAPILVGEPLQRRAGHAVHRPLAHRLGAERAVEADGALVPVEDGPLEAAAAALAGDRGEAREERAAD